MMLPSGTVSCSEIPTMKTGDIYATDLEQGPVADKYKNCIKMNANLIQVEHQEQLAFGELRCRLRGKAIVVGVYKKDGAIVGRELYFIPDDKNLLKRGAKIPEAVFAVQVREFVGTPWHEIDSVSIWTVAGLRKNGKREFYKEEN